MIIFMSLLTVIVLYFVFQFILVLVKLKGEVIFPVTEDELAAIRKFPDKELKPPTYEGQKGGIIFFSIVVLFLIVAQGYTWNYFDYAFTPTYLLMLLPLVYANQLMNLFGVTKDGVIAGSRFVPWKRIKGYELRRIDVNHKYYGHSKEVNDTLELKLHTRFLTLNCIITTEEMKDKLIALLKDKNVEDRLISDCEKEKGLDKTKVSQ